MHLGLVLLHPRASMMKRRAVGFLTFPHSRTSVELSSLGRGDGLSKGRPDYRIEGKTVGSLSELRKALNKPRPRNQALQHFARHRSHRTLTAC